MDIFGHGNCIPSKERDHEHLGPAAHLPRGPESKLKVMGSHKIWLPPSVHPFL